MHPLLLAVFLSLGQIAIAFLVAYFIYNKGVVKIIGREKIYEIANMLVTRGGMNITAA